MKSWLYNALAWVCFWLISCFLKLDYGARAINGVGREGLGPESRDPKRVANLRNSDVSERMVFREVGPQEA